MFDTLVSYLLALKLYHINWHLNLEGFDNPRMTFIIKRKRKLFLSIKRNGLLITKDIFQNIMEDESLLVMDFNIDITF